MTYPLSHSEWASKTGQKSYYYHVIRGKYDKYTEISS